MNRGDNASVLRVRVFQRNSVELKIHQAGKPPWQVASFPLADSWIFFFLSVLRVCVAARHGERWGFPAQQHGQGPGGVKPKTPQRIPGHCEQTLPLKKRRRKKGFSDKTRGVKPGSWRCDIPKMPTVLLVGPLMLEPEACFAQQPLQQCLRFFG